MVWIFGVAIFVLLGVVVGLMFKLIHSSQTPSLADQLTQQMQKDLLDLRHSLQEQILAIQKQMGDQYAQNTRFLSDSHRQYSDSVDKVQTRLGELQESTKTMVLIGRDIASLQDILKTPKLRGGLGEFFLGQLLAQILPQECFELQYGFKDGNKVDAIIRLGEWLIPVDAKFPLENFRRYVEENDEEKRIPIKKEFYKDVKKRIDEIADKYILPQEGTADFAMMYIPAENVYYEIILKSDNQTESIFEYAMKRKVIPTSPNSLYAYLQAIVRGLKGLRIERSALQVLEALQQLENDFKKISIELEKMGGHLGNAQSAHDRVTKNFDRVQNKLTALGDSREHQLSESKNGLAHQEA